MLSSLLEVIKAEKVSFYDVPVSFSSYSLILMILMEKLGSLNGLEVTFPSFTFLLSSRKTQYSSYIYTVMHFAHSFMHLLKFSLVKGIVQRDVFEHYPQNALELFKPVIP